jgi:branched-subunit amino acid aminotransferase/4-amino-4-deoxychorismate lyase
MAQTGAVERSLTLVDLAQADEIILGNSVRGPVRVGEILEKPW